MHYTKYTYLNNLLYILYYPNIENINDPVSDALFQKKILCESQYLAKT